MAFDRKRKRTQDASHEDYEEEAGNEHADLREEQERNGTADEDEEWTGLGQGQEGDDVRSHADHAEMRPAKPPTGEELRNIKDATDLYRSNSFKLQIDALLPNVRPKYQRSAPLDRLLRSIYTCLSSLPSLPPQHPLSASRELMAKGIAVPYSQPLPTEDTNWKVSFQKPDDILLVGSWPNKLSVKAKDQLPYTADVAVEMPASLFLEKDYLNGRFFHKRAYYLAVIASAILDRKNGLEVDASYTSMGGDPRLTVLVVRSNSESSDDFSKLNAQIRIIPSLSADSPVALHRLSPSKSSLRTHSSSSDSPAELATPIYNSALMLSTTPRAHLLRIHALKQKVPAFGDALTLLRVWANQRGYGEGRRLCIRGFEGKGMWWAAILDLLINGEEPPGSGFGKPHTKRKLLAKGLSSYQLFRAALNFLAKHDFAHEPVFLKTENGHRFMPHEYESHEVVFVDATSAVNLLAGVSLSSLAVLQHDARVTLDVLDSGIVSEDPFPEVFLKECRDLHKRFDVLLRVDLSSAKLRKQSTHLVLDSGSAFNSLMATVVTTLRAALGNRTTAIAILHSTSEPRALSQAHPSNPPIVYIGLVLDPEHAFRLVDYGPRADDPDSQAVQRFRELWGEKAELRRFKDGSIMESVVWDVKNSDERAHIPYYICQHILQRHCDITEQNVQSWQSSFDAVLRLPESVTSTYLAASAAAGSKAALTAFDKLVKEMKALDEELPLAILNVSPVSPSLRYMNVFSPIPVPPSSISSMPPCSRYVQPMEIVIEFEKSGRWPDDLRAIQKIKLAFFERLASALMRANQGLKATVVVGGHSPTSDIQDSAKLEVITQEGWAFSAHIWHDREATLLDSAIDDRPHVPKHLKPVLDPAKAKERRSAIEAKEVYTRRFIHAPRHHRAIAALCHRHSAFAGTVRLVKRWLASHWLLGGHVSEEVVELLCASIFLKGGQSGIPSTKERGFSMAVELLKNWRWEEGLHVPLYDAEATKAETSEQSKVTGTAGAKSGVWAVSTELDPDGHMWTSTGPDAITARRIQAIAKATCDCLQGVENGDFNVKTLFAHPTEHYDFIIELNPAVIPRYYQNIHADPAVWIRKGKYANRLPSSEDPSDQGLQAGFDPAQLLYDDLSRIYKDTFKLFHDPLGGDRFGGVWDPSLKNPRPFRALGGFSSAPASKESTKSKDKTLVMLNTDAVMSEIERLGSGIIKSIIMQV